MKSRTISIEKLVFALLNKLGMDILNSIFVVISNIVNSIRISEHRMIKISLILLLTTFLTFPLSAQEFKADQLRYSRVRESFKEKETWLDNLAQMDVDKFSLFVRAFKKEEEVEVWVKTGEVFEKLITYEFCTSSGTLGPKRVEGDLQIPEGIYHINIFNPYSSFYLSLGLNYPNKSDRILGNKERPGSDIYIHGSCATIGCIPITDDKIKELYILAVEARDQGQERIPVHIYPTRLTDKNRTDLNSVSDVVSTLQLWDDLKNVYDYFEKNKSIPEIRINNEGRYIIIER